MPRPTARPTARRTVARASAAVALAGGLALAPVGLTPAGASPAGAGAASAAQAHGDRGHSPLPGTIPLAPGSRPEGIAAGPGDTLFAGSRLDGAIYVLRTDGSRRLLVAGTPLNAARGLQYDRRTGTLWVAGDVRASDAQPTTSTVTQYDARTGALLQRFVVPGQRFLNDVQVTRGAVYVTDSANPELVVVRSGAFSLLPLTGDWVQTTGNNANGIRQLPGGDLIVTQSSTGDLYRVDRRTGRADRIEVSGVDLTSGDGLELRGSTLYVVFGQSTNAISVVRLSDGGRSGRFVGSLTDPTSTAPPRPCSRAARCTRSTAGSRRPPRPPLRTTWCGSSCASGSTGGRRVRDGALPHR